MPAQPSLQVTYPADQSDQYQEHVHQQLLQVTQVLKQLSQMMASCLQQSSGDIVDNNSRQVRWTAPEESALVQYLHEHKAERGDGNFKDPTLCAALEHIKNLRIAGKEKDLKSVQNKWSSIKAIFSAIIAYRKLSGVHWDNTSGANIQGEVASSMFEEYVSHKTSSRNRHMKRFRNQGWPFLEMMEEIYPDASATGHFVFRPTTTVQCSAAAPAITPAIPTIACGQDGNKINDDNQDGNGGTSITTAATGPASTIYAASTTAINTTVFSDAMDIFLPASPAPISTISSASIISPSNRNKHPFSVVSPDESGPSLGPSLLFSPANQTSSYSFPPSSRQSSKCGRVSTPKGDKQTLDIVAMNMINNTICNLSDSISTSFADKLSIIKAAGEQLYNIPGLSTEEILEIGEYFTENERKASFFLSLHAKERAAYIYKLRAKLTGVAGPSSEAGPSSS